MTTIAYRNGLLAADGRMTVGETIITEYEEKIVRLSDGSLLALTGTTEVLEDIRAYLEDDEDAELPKRDGETDFTAILLEPNGILSIYEGIGGGFRALSVEYAAWGTGSDVAYGALEMGASAERAVQAAMNRNIMTGGTILVCGPGYVEPS